MRLYWQALGPILMTTVGAGAQLERGRTFERVKAELAAGRRSEAKLLLIDAAEEFQSVRALLQLARLQSGDGDAAGALESLQRAREWAPNSEDVLSAFAQVSLAARRPMPAVLALQSMTRLFPTVGPHHYLLGVALMQVGDLPGAVDSLRAAERLEPDRPLTLIALGLALNARKLFAEAKPFLLRSLELAPESADALGALAESEEGLGELEEAEAHAQRALAKSSEQATANLVMGMVRMKQGRYGEARDALEKAAAADPDSPKAHYQLSLAYARLGEDAISQRHLESYRLKLREAEERLRALRLQMGDSRGRMGR
jgi:tetratricopeptide (TPR) repeat protein